MSQSENQIDVGTGAESPCVDGPTLAFLLGVSIRTVQQLTTDGKLPKQGSRWNLRDCITAHRNHCVANAVARFKGPDGAGDDDEVSAAIKSKKLEKLTIDTEVSQIKLNEIKNESHTAADVSALYGNMVVTIRSRLQAMPHLIAPQIHGKESIPEIIEITNNAVNTVLMELKDYDPQEFAERNKQTIRVIDPEKLEANREEIAQFNEIYGGAE